MHNLRKQFFFFSMLAKYRFRIRMRFEHGFVADIHQREYSQDYGISCVNSIRIKQGVWWWSLVLQHPSRFLFWNLPPLFFSKYNRKLIEHPLWDLFEIGTVECAARLLVWRDPRKVHEPCKTHSSNSNKKWRKYLTHIWVHSWKTVLIIVLKNIYITRCSYTDTKIGLSHINFPATAYFFFWKTFC